ncbi:unnamed protein product [Leptosia nina]|uniref:Peptidase S1 domain-containing protein n=1 Tax=Leptosia nina TaxID=320188 RepID=A0AAV1J6B9_9NEOP
MGGDPIRIEEAPFMAIFKRRDQEYGCGGTIVHKRSNMVIVVGTDRVQGGQYYDIMASYPHPKFQRDYDVVVLKLAKDLLFSSKVQPIQMAERGMDINDGAVLRVMGFGMTDPNDVRSF